MNETEIADLNELQILLEKLRFALIRQRNAVAALDLSELGEALAEKRHLVDEIALARRAIPVRELTKSGDPVLDQVRKQVSRLAIEVRCTAQANQALLFDAKRIVGCVLGTEAPLVGYNRRARRETEPRQTFAKAV